MNNGSFAAALTTYESIMKRPTKRPLARAAYLAACRARNFPKAKVLFSRLGQESLAQICMKEGFDPGNGARPERAGAFGMRQVTPGSPTVIRLAVTPVLRVMHRPCVPRDSR